MSKIMRERLFDADVRFEKTLWLAAIGSEDQYPDDFADFVESVFDDHNHPIFETLECMKNLCGDDYPEYTDVVDALIYAGKFGVLVQAATPVRRYLKGGTAYESGWRCYHTTWLYADDLMEAGGQALLWADKMAALDKRKADGW